jgi:hypothetical protein
MNQKEFIIYRSISNIREEIRRDIQDYKLLCFLEERMSDEDFFCKKREDLVYEFKHNLLDSLFDSIEKLNGLSTLDEEENE